MIMKHITHSEQDTIKVAHEFAETLEPGSVVALIGDLGAGKTVFARGVAKFLEIQEKITSPTFTLINEYNGKFRLYHMDLYRLNSVKEIEDLGIDDYLYGDGICLIEWAEKLDDRIPPYAITVTLKLIVRDTREITIERNDA
ncbi:MAG: tRNA (adenosine(37)-N6)-threonylcarbamoyltransferase complex ATPase subunit type 1 TsaE [Candidatus Latescibacteria bacterium]|nr:tRNA (adenosine(37)-N6)-threonylcarbamoyltransferase complex ATPase subunit type 1 TsaE [Candidatus Latescibacterota bacterium]